MEEKTMSPEQRRMIAAEIAPGGVLRAGINLSNFLLVSGTNDNGEPYGVAPDMARAVGSALDLPVQLVPFATPGEIVDAAPNNVWDLCLIGAEPARAAIISFTKAYVEILATYLVSADTSIQSVEEVDRPGVRIAVAERTAYDLWLTDNIKHATLVHAKGIDAAFNMFVEQRLEALACLKSRLLTDVKKVPGARILKGHFTSVQQAIGTHKANIRSAEFLSDFVHQAIVSGEVAQLIAKHGVEGLSVAPA
jgi:polar amino acid transport system substrate-binding protein